MSSMRINGQPADTVSALDRGLGYGDGLFETVRFLGRTAPLWSRHMRRLDEGCRRIQLPSPSPAWLLAEAQALLDERAERVAQGPDEEEGEEIPELPAPGETTEAFGEDVHLSEEELEDEDAFSGLAERLDALSEPDED